MNGRASKRIRIAARDIHRDGGDYRQAVKTMKAWFKALTTRTKMASPSHRSVLRAYHAAGGRHG